MFKLETNMCTINTQDKILNASIVLFSQKGYSSVTTKEISKEACVSEMTLFRHFESKHNLFEKAFDKFVFSPKFIALFEGLEWNLERDSTKICSSYQDTCLLYTSDAADEEDSVDLGGR